MHIDQKNGKVEELVVERVKNFTKSYNLSMVKRLPDVIRESVINL